MEYQTVDSTFADRLASKDFDPQEFVREVVSESIGDSDVLANKVKLQAFAERTARNLRDSVTRNYSKFLATADEVALLEDEMYHLRSLSNHCKAVMNFLKDFVIKEELRDMQTEKSAGVQRKGGDDAKSYDSVGSPEASRLDGKKDESQMLTSLSILIDQAESIGLINPWSDNRLERLKTRKMIDGRESSFNGEAAPTSHCPPGLITDDGRRLLHQAHLTLMDSDTLLEKAHVQFFLLEGCILLCTSVGPTRQEGVGVVDESVKPRPTRLNLLTAIDVDSSLSVTDVKDSTDLSKLGGPSFRNTFKLSKKSREIFILRATSAQSKAACLQSISSYLEQIVELDHKQLGTGWSPGLDGTSPEGTDVILSLLSDQLAQLELAICHRQQNLAEELILHCRQRLSNMAPEVRATSEGSQMDVRLNRLERKLVKQIRNGPKTLRDRGRCGQGLRDPKREINLLKRLGYNSDAIELFIGYQRMSFPTQRRFDGAYSLDVGNWDVGLNMHSDKGSLNHGSLDSRYNESFSDTLKSQIEHELNNRIAVFFDSIRRAEQNFYDNFGTERTECASTFLVWLGAEIDATVNNILYEAYGTRESADGCWVLGRIVEVVKMLSDGALSVASNGVEPGTSYGGTAAVSTLRRLDITFLIEQKVASAVNLAIREDKQKFLDLIRSWGRSANRRLTSEPLQLTVRSPGIGSVYTSNLVTPPTFLAELMNLAPEIVDSLNELITVNGRDDGDTASRNDGSSLSFNATLNLTYCTVVFSKLLIAFVKQCFGVYMERTKPCIVESVVELVKLYLRFLGQMFNQAIGGSGQEASDQHAGAALTSEDKSTAGPDVEFVFSNIEFVVSVLFALVDGWFQRLAGGPSKHFTKIYEKLERYRQQIEAYRTQNLL